MATNEEIMSVWEEFKTANDERLAAIEANVSDPIAADKLSKLEEALQSLTGTVQDVVEEQKSLAKKSGRPGTTGAGADAEYKTLFNGFMRKGRNEEELQTKSLTIGGDTGRDGGVTVPAFIDFNIREQLINVSPMRQLAEVITTTTGDHTVLLNVRGTASGWVAETDERDETATPKINKIKVPVGEIYANIAATQTLLDDSAIDVESWIAAQIADQFAVAEGAAFITGTGTNQPKGLLASGNGFAVTASGSAAALDKPDALIDLVYGLKAGHRANGNFLGNSATEATVRKLKDTTGNYLWAPGLNGERGTLLGYQFYNDENMPNVAANATPLAFGDFKAGYTIADRKSFTLIRDPFTNKPYVMFYVTSRVGGTPTNNEAIRLLKIAAS
ncbi:HK97 family phage major capsid protein [Sphingobium sp. B7D2B]|uniref:phage major capsid protein n=1 Tax=Sphingobium sp. B7D2B TaxID=2940583 RepID=UPI0022255E24|nr:phage major capsid protein [Sphingobium sp. B7D2B]MCW2365555.1 HK97 family phage major capsid protein [Sphingobium sp. B7D2B]